MFFLDRFFSNCDTYANKIAISFFNDDSITDITYSDLAKNINQVASYLVSLGVKKGDRVAIQLPKSLEFIYFHMAAMRLGAISLPLNPAFPAAELDYFLKDSEAKVYIGDELQKANFEELFVYLDLEHSVFIDFYSAAPLSFLSDSSCPLANLPKTPDQTALMIYTSGTTGRPKGAELTHENLTAGINGLHEAWAWQDNDVLLHVLPIFHTHGLMVALHGALNAGASIKMLHRFDAKKTLELLDSKAVTVFMAVPTIHGKLLDEASTRTFDFSSMRLMTSGSARLPDDFFKAYRQTFNYTLLERYGMTETGMNLSNPYQGERRVGSVGMPLPGVQARVVNPANNEVLADGEVGEVQVKGKHVFKGYWRQIEKTAESFTPDGWLKTGDMGLREADNYFTLKGRSKDLIISGGFNVYPPEIELVLAEHPSVAASAVIGCEDQLWGERVVAVLELKAGADEDADSIITFCKERLASYKSPKEVHFMSEFPRNAMGKVQKAKLRQQFCLKQA